MAERLAPSERPQWPLAWSPDGRTLLFDTVGGTAGQATHVDIWTLPYPVEQPARPLLASRFLEGNPAPSPDGRWIAYTSNESGTRQIYVQRFPDLGQRRQISTDGGYAAIWSPDGTELFYRETASRMYGGSKKRSLGVE